MAGNKFNYKALLTQCSVQESTLKKLEEEKEKIDQQHKNALKDYKKVLEIYRNQEKELQNKILKRQELVDVLKTLGTWQGQLNEKVLTTQSETDKTRKKLNENSTNFFEQVNINSKRLLNLKEEYNENEINNKIQICKSEIAQIKLKNQQLKETLDKKMVLMKESFKKNQTNKLMANLKPILNEEKKLNNKFGDYPEQLKRIEQTEKNIAFLKQKYDELQQKMNKTI